MKIQTPPPRTPEELYRTLSVDDGANGVRQPPPVLLWTQGDDEGSDTTATADEAEGSIGLIGSHSDYASGAGGSGAPFNPFARTLATKEAQFGLQRNANGADQQDGEGSDGKKKMDVDMFKNILLTGSAAPSPPAGSLSAGTASSINTEASSASQTSYLDPWNQETPRTSFDQIDSASDSSDGEDEERSGLMSGSTTRLDDFAPPAPPKQSAVRPAARRGPQTVSFSDFDEEITEASRTKVPGGHGHMQVPPTLHRVGSDLNKPLPPPPENSTPRTTEVPAEYVSMQDEPSIAVAGDNLEEKKAPPPPPPVSRRVGQPTGRRRSSSNGTQASLQEEAISVNKAVPPPPPARKAKASPALVAEKPASTPPPAPTLEQVKAVPPPPPRRMASRAGSSMTRTSSTASRSSIQRSDAPPAPPPRRARRESSDLESNAVNEATTNAETSTDILADMSAFQAEIEALRRKAGGEG